jgi:hypothetical protein
MSFWVSLFFSEITFTKYVPLLRLDTSVFDALLLILNSLTVLPVTSIIFTEAFSFLLNFNVKKSFAGFG